MENELIAAFPVTEPMILLLWIAAFAVGPLQRSTKWVFLVVCGIAPVDWPDPVRLTDVGLAIFVLAVSPFDNAAVVVVEIAAVAATAVKVKSLFQLNVVGLVKPMYEVLAAAEVPFAVIPFAAFRVYNLVSSLFGKEKQL